VSYESATGTIGHINLDEKTTEKRSAGKPHAAFDEAGAGNGRFNVPRQFSTLPVRGVEGSSHGLNIVTLYNRKGREIGKTNET
jgi:hypothetical protein